jgi:hypothetical protein
MGIGRLRVPGGISVFGQSVRDTARTYGRQLARVVAIQALLVLAFTIVTVIVASLARQAVVGLTGYMAPGGQAAADRVLGVALAVIVVGIVLLLPFAVATVAGIVGVADDSLGGRRGSLFRWLARGLRRWIPITGALIVATVVPVALLLAAPVLVAVGLVGLAVIGAGRLLRRRDADDSGPAPSRHRWVLMAIPFAPLVLAVPTALLVVPAAVLEFVGPLEARRIARRQVTSARWAVFGTVAIAFVAYVGISVLAAWLLPLLFDSGAAQFVSLLLAVVLLPIVLVAMTAAYRNAAGPSGRALEPAERKARAASRRAAEPGFAARVAMLVVACLVISLAIGGTAGAAFADEPQPTDLTAATPAPDPTATTALDPTPTPAPTTAPEPTPTTVPTNAQTATPAPTQRLFRTESAGSPITPTITIDAANTVTFGDTLGIDVNVSDLATLTYPVADVKYWVYQGTPVPDPAQDSVSGWADGGLRSLTLPDGDAHFDVDSSYLSPGVYSLKTYFEPESQDAANFTTAVTDWNFTVLPRTSISLDAPTTPLGGSSAVTAYVGNVDGGDAPQGAVQFRWHANPDGAWSSWSSPVVLAGAGNYSVAVLRDGLTLGAIGAYEVEAHYLPTGLFGPTADVDTLLVVGSSPTYRETISYGEPHAGAPTAFVIRIEADSSSPDAVTSIPPSGDGSLIVYRTDTLTGGPASGPPLAICPDTPLTPVAGEALTWQYTCTVSFDTPGVYGLISGAYGGDDLWQVDDVVYNPSQRFTVAEVVKGDPTLSLTSTDSSWIGADTIPLQWSVTGPTAGTTLTLSRDGTPIATLSGTSGAFDVTLPANLGSSADTIPTTFTLAYAGGALWNSASTSLTQGVTACIPVDAGTVSPGGAGTISLATPTTCGSGPTAGFTPGTVVHWTVTPSDTTTMTGVHLTGDNDASLVSVGGNDGTDISTVADRSRVLALTAEFETTCATVTMPLSVTVDEISNCGPATGWTLIARGSTILKSNTFLAGTILHLGYTLPDATSTFSGWSGTLASGASMDAKVGARVTNSGIGVTPTFAERCFPVTLTQAGAVGHGSLWTSENCHLPGVTAPGNVYTGFMAGTAVTVGVLRPNEDSEYTASITVAQEGASAARTTFPGYVDGSEVSTSFVIAAPTMVSWAAGHCVLIDTIGVNANHDSDLSMSNPRLYTHVASPGCGDYPPGAVGPSGDDSSAYAALGDTVSISAVSPLGASEKLHFQGWQRGSGDPSGFTPPNQAAFQWKVTGPADFDGYWGQAVNCQSINVVMVPANAFTRVQLASTQANGCPAGTFDLGDTLSVGSGDATVRVSATPNTAVSQGAVYGIGYASNSYNASSKATAPVSAKAVGGVSRAIPAFGATTVTLYACEGVDASAQLKSPADGKYYTADASQDADFFFVSPAQNCVIDDKSYWSVGSSVDVAAAPQESGFAFTGWEGNPGVVDGTIVTVSLAGHGPSVNAVADFDLTCFTLTSNYAEGVNASPAPNCPGYPTSQHKWIAGTVITLTVDDKAMQDNVTYFDGWTGGPDTVTNETAGLILDRDRAVYADFRADDVVSNFERTASALAQTYVGVIAGALGGLLLASNPLTAVLGLVNTILGGVVSIAGALGASGSVLDALTSAADATQWLSNLVTAPMSCISSWSGGDYGTAGDGKSTPEGAAGRAIGKAVSKEWTRMSQGTEQSTASATVSAGKNALAAYQVINGWVANLDNDPSQTWSSFTGSFASCMTQSVYPPGT